MSYIFIKIFNESFTLYKGRWKDNHVVVTNGFKSTKEESLVLKFDSKLIFEYLNIFRWLMLTCFSNQIDNHSYFIAKPLKYKQQQQISLYLIFFLLFNNHFTTTSKLLWLNPSCFPSFLLRFYILKTQKKSEKKSENRSWWNIYSLGNFVKKKPTVIKITTRHQIKRLYNLLFISKFKEIKEKENCALKTIHQ